MPAGNFLEHATMAQVSTQISNKAIVQESLDRWKSGNGSPFELLIPEAEWTIVGSSPLSKTYHSRKEFLDEVGGPFDARVAKPPVRTVRGIYADGDMVIILFDIDATARDGLPYHNVYTWYFQMKDAKVIKESPSSIPGFSTNSGHVFRRSRDASSTAMLVALTRSKRSLLPQCAAATIVAQPFDGSRQAIDRPKRCSTAASIRSRTSSLESAATMAVASKALILTSVFVLACNSGGSDWKLSV
jgi:uncharacterized protein